ncbi:DNA-3-methyladenine glycosylase I [Nocardioides houyundeii]|uniref:DNA-3-methyladenine glycosylase I n=1 Tax=Nocardioides houyundeii TaxID=2045452 RepID=UPI001965CC45
MLHFLVEPSQCNRPALAKRPQKAGFRWVGPNSAYAFMQNVGIVNGHVQGCYLAA